MHKVLSSPLLALSLCVAAVSLATPAAAQSNNAELRSQKQRAPVRTAPQASQRPNSQGQLQEARRQLFSPLGRTPANVRPNRYQRIYSQPTVQNTAPNYGQVYSGHAPGYGAGPGYGPNYGPGYGVPYVVYVDPTPREPQVAQEPEPRSYEPPPIYIVQPNQPPRPVQPIEPSQAGVAQTPVWRPAATVPQSDPVVLEPERPRPPRSTEPQPVSMRIVPAGADVYLDGEFLGNSADLAELDLRPGVYVLEVEHPEYGNQRLVFGVDDGPLSVTVDLTADRPSRRSRVK